ncbi:hypothetical protein NMY22_g19603 [Coprinellus aureogranulatus]|nr:hypothetical protein NMY22_g19603 [Coprinellus aureogranulatus]
MSRINRSENIDAAMYHNNRLKLEGLAEALPKQLERAKEELREAEEHLENVRKSTEPADREKWREQLEKANSERKRNPKSMDIFLVKNPPGVWRLCNNDCRSH